MFGEFLPIFQLQKLKIKDDPESPRILEQFWVTFTEILKIHLVTVNVAHKVHFGAMCPPPPLAFVGVYESS